VSRYQKNRTSLDFTEKRDSKWQWQWHQLGHMQVCISFQTDNHASTPSPSFLQAGCPSCRPTNSVKALKAQALFSYLHMLKTWHCPHLRLCTALRPRAAADQYLLPAGPTAANPAHLLQRANGTDRQTGGESDRQKNCFCSVIITST